jgi:hypothetical protein
MNKLFPWLVGIGKQKDRPYRISFAVWTLLGSLQSNFRILLLADATRFRPVLPPTIMTFVGSLSLTMAVAPNNVVGNWSIKKLAYFFFENLEKKKFAYLDEWTTFC